MLYIENLYHKCHGENAGKNKSAGVRFKLKHSSQGGPAKVTTDLRPKEGAKAGMEGSTKEGSRERNFYLPVSQGTAQYMLTRKS